MSGTPNRLKLTIFLPPEPDAMSLRHARWPLANTSEHTGWGAVGCGRVQGLQALSTQDNGVATLKQA